MNLKKGIIMATVYFVREGRGDGRTSQGREFSLAEIIRTFPELEPVWSQGAPVFNSDSFVNPVSDFRYVVINIKKSECNGKFTRDGYWTFKGLSPSEFEQKLRKSW